jgi:hypothetical protein
VLSKPAVLADISIVHVSFRVTVGAKKIIETVTTVCIYVQRHPCSARLRGPQVYQLGCIHILILQPHAHQDVSSAPSCDPWLLVAAVLKRQTLSGPLTSASLVL